MVSGLVAGRRLCLAPPSTYAGHHHLHRHALAPVAAPLRLSIPRHLLRTTPLCLPAELLLPLPLRPCLPPLRASSSSVVAAALALHSELSRRWQPLCKAEYRGYLTANGTWVDWSNLYLFTRFFSEVQHADQLAPNHQKVLYTAISVFIFLTISHLPLYGTIPVQLVSVPDPSYWGFKEAHQK